MGDLRVHHQAAHRGGDHRQDAGRRADQGRLQVHRRVPDGRRLRGERRVLHAHLRGAAARREPPRVPKDRAAAVAARRIARAPDRRHSTTGWDVADAYGVLADLDQVETFLKAVAASDGRRDRVRRHRRGPAVRVGRPRAARPRRAGAALRGVPAQLRDRGREGRCGEVHAQGLPGRRRRRRPATASSAPSTIYDRDGEDVVGLADRHHRRRQDGDGGGGDRGAVLRQRDVRLRARPGRGRDLVLRRPEPQRPDPVPADGRRPRSSRRPTS